MQCFGPLAFLDVPGSEESASGQSLQNSSEAEMALHLFSGLLERYPALRRQPGRIGIMSPYKGQVPVLDWCCWSCHHHLHWWRHQVVEVKSDSNPCLRDVSLRSHAGAEVVIATGVVSGSGAGVASKANLCPSACWP